MLGPLIVTQLVLVSQAVLSFFPKITKMVPGRTATCTYVLFLEPNTDELVWRPILYTVGEKQSVLWD